MSTIPEINSCHIATPATRTDSDIYRSIRDRIIKAHCADKREAHKCAGKITIDREHITFQCPRCGDARNLIRPEGEIP
jgi:predicted RNA-binding Zn-ribbon protein involved in translation (DUF1610 family)